MIRLALRTGFNFARGVRTAELIQKVHTAFLQAKLSPLVRFTMLDGPAHRTSSVQRVVRRFPEMSSLDHTRPVSWEQGRLERLIGNDLGSPGFATPANVLLLADIADGIPKQYPFFSAAIRITNPVFGDDLPDAAEGFWPGLVIEDSWGNARRSIGLRAVVIVEADPAARSLPALPPPVRAVLDACGLAAGMKQTVLSGQDPNAAEQAASIATGAKARLGEIAEQIRLPHHIPKNDDEPYGPAAGSRKPVLAEAIRPLGYDCRGSGMMDLVCVRRTTANITTMVDVGFGTWSDQVQSSWSARWLGCALSVKLPDFPKSGPGGMNWIVDATRWRQIVENLTTLVAELDQSILPIIEATAAATPAWYEPGVGMATHRLRFPTIGQVPRGTLNQRRPNGSNS